MSTAEPSTAPPSTLQESPCAFVADRVDGLDDFAASIAGLGAAAVVTPFQRPAWLRSWYETVGRHSGIDPLLVRVRDATSGAISMLLPLVVERQMPATRIRFADGGLTDYCVPILGPAAPATAESAYAAWQSVLACLPPADLICLDRMPARIDGRVNPLGLLETKASREVRNAVDLATTFEGYMAGRSAHFRKLLRQKMRALERIGPVAFDVVGCPDGARRSHQVLCELQRQRLQETGGRYTLGEPHIAAFYEQLVATGTRDGSVAVTRLTVGGKLVAVGLTLLHGNTGTMVRMAHAGGAYDRMSPGLLLACETIRWLISRGTRTFDFGVGKFDYKQRFGCEAMTLLKLDVPLTIRGAAALRIAHARDAVMKSEALRALWNSWRRRTRGWWSGMARVDLGESQELNRPKRDELRLGDIVEVLSEPEIRATLDGKGALDGLPFMPEMRRYCGQRLRVARTADRTCVEGEGERMMADAVFLDDARCDGSAHDGCQRHCLMFWKSAWLRRVAGPAIGAPTPTASSDALAVLPIKQGDRYYCQSTELVRATERPPKSVIAAIGIVIRDLRRGEVAPGRFVRIMAWLIANKLHMAAGLGVLGQPTGDGHERSKGNLGLKPGDKVAIRPLADIRSTLDAKGRNRGLGFDPEMTVYRGPYEVEGQVERIILETTGKMQTLTNTVTLKGVSCQGLCAKNCPRANPIYWREIWLDKVE